MQAAGRIVAVPPTLLDQQVRNSSMCFVKNGGTIDFRSASFERILRVTVWLKHGNNTMILEWFNAREAAKIGAALADQFAPREAANSTSGAKQSAARGPNDVLRTILQRAEHEIQGLRLNFYKKAKFANSFKWRLLENGVEQATVDELTQSLVLHLSGSQVNGQAGHHSDTGSDRPASNDAKSLLTQGNKSIARGAYAEAIVLYQNLITLNPRHATALNNLGTALYKLGRYKEAEGRFFEALKIQPAFPDALSNIGTVFLLKGLYFDAENFLRQALKLTPRFVDARVNLGLTLAFTNRMRDAKSHFEKALKYEPRNAEALFGMAVVAKTEGSFDHAGAMLSRALQISPGMSKALASQAGMRKMTLSDGDWLKSAEQVAASGIAPVNESELRFAIGKYYDDIEDFKHAFQNYKRANDLLKPIAEPYDRAAYKSFVDTMLQVYSPDAVARAGAGDGISVSMKPVFVVGMPRSGTSLTEQIIASHPSAKGAGELEFWSQVAHDHEDEIKAGPLGESIRKKLAEVYLRVLDTKAGRALRAVDKAPVNSDYVGVIHSVFPNARFIYMQRDPIDTCLSCYFQKFALSLNFTMDLSDLADYYRQHHRLMAHWCAVLPPGTLLAIPYEELVVDQEGCTRKILDFLGLEWDQQVLDFHNTKRAVVTNSFWQVRQKIYKNSVRRWRHYEKFIGPLLDLKDLAP
jgi:tetratricopeptide (TPR) repeat protein